MFVEAVPRIRQIFSRTKTTTEYFPGPRRFELQLGGATKDDSLLLVATPIFRSECSTAVDSPAGTILNCGTMTN